MSRKKRIFIILHLIFAFTLLSWLVMKPYVMEVVARKSHLALYEMVMEKEALFHSLPQAEQAEVIEGFAKAEAQTSPSFFHQIGHLFFVETSPFTLAWIFFSILICMLILFRIEGAEAVVWILPLLVVGYAFSLYSSKSQDKTGFFPSEHYVQTHYAQESAGLNKREQLLKAWHLYLINEWTGEQPSGDSTVFEAQLERALFAFNLARLKWIQEGKGDEVVLAGFTSTPSLFRVLSYFMWNVLFAWMINRRPKVSHSAPLSNPS